MTTVLALDTCDRTAGVAVAVGDEVRCWRVEHSVLRHSVRLLGMVEEALVAAAVGKDDLDLVTVSRGPGSFTGVRVGIATAKGLGFALGIPVVGLSSLETMIRGASPFPGVVVPVLDARKKQVYALARHGGPGGRILIEEGAWPPATVIDALAGTEGPCLFLGSGLAPYADEFSRALGDRFHAAPVTRWPVHPGELALAGLDAFRRGEAGSPAELAPSYRRLSEAEVARQV